VPLGAPRYPANYREITREGISLLLSALATQGACFILGAGASAPDLPLTGEIGLLAAEREYGRECLTHLTANPAQALRSYGELVGD